MGEVERVDGVGEVGSLACGDALRLTIQVNPDGIIEDARFQTFGCASAIASSSALTEMIKGTSLDKASEVTNQDIAEYLGGMPKEKMHCSVMGMEALEAGHCQLSGRNPPTDGRGSDLRVLRSHRQGHRNASWNRIICPRWKRFTDYTKAGGGCGRCHEKIEALLYRIMAKRREAAAQTPAAPKKLTFLQKIKLIEETIEREIRPALKTGRRRYRTGRRSRRHGLGQSSGNLRLLRGQPVYPEGLRGTETQGVCNH